MIIRARPKYLTKKMILSCMEGAATKSGADLLYFNSGRAALKFFLSELARFRRHPLKIVMQSFNCHVVMDAALEAGCIVQLVDIKKTDFSMGVQMVEKFTDADVVLLTHYQGVPNTEYLKIVNFAQENKIIVIEDLSQTYGSKISGVQVGTLGDAWIESYAFDKPFSCMFGGALHVNTCSDLLPQKFIDNTRQSFYKLPCEEVRLAYDDLRLLLFVFTYSDRNTYHPLVNQYDFINHMLKITSDKRLISVLGKIYTGFKINKIINKINSLHKKIQILKMNPVKSALIEMQKENFIWTPLPGWCLDFIDESRGTDSLINWNRLSVLDPEGLIEDSILRKFNHEIEIGNYNWRVPLHKIYADTEKVLPDQSYVNSEYACEHILNIPIWQNEQSEGS